MRSGLIIFSVFCVATLASEVLGLAFLWYRGQLTPETLKEIRVALTGEAQDELGIDEEERNSQPSIDDVLARRSMGILELNTRQTELDLLKNMIDAEKDDLKTQADAFKAMKESFETQLSQLNANAASESTQRAQGILLALSPADAVENLMQISLEENIVLLKSMPEKEIAKILQEFFKGEKEQSERGRQIFGAISQGEPAKKLIDKAGQQLTQKPSTPEI